MFKPIELAGRFHEISRKSPEMGVDLQTGWVTLRNRARYFVIISHKFITVAMLPDKRTELLPIPFGIDDMVSLEITNEEFSRILIHPDRDHWRMAMPS